MCLPWLHPRRALGRSTSSQNLEIRKKTACSKRPKHPLGSWTPVTQGAFIESNICERERVHWGYCAAGLKSLVVAPPALISWCRSSRSILATDSIPWSITATEYGHHWYHYSSTRPTLWSSISEQKKRERWLPVDQIRPFYNTKAPFSQFSICNQNQFHLFLFTLQSSLNLIWGTSFNK